MHGAPALPEDFAAMPYVNPQAPKGGRLVEGVLGTFDSLNPLIVQGLAVQADPRLRRSKACWRAATTSRSRCTACSRARVETDDARELRDLQLDPAARFSDGVPVTADDVVFSWQLLRDHGRPNHRTYYSKVRARPRSLDKCTVRFDLAGATIANCR